MYRSKQSGLYSVQDRYVTGNEYKTRFNGAVAETWKMIKGLYTDGEYILATKATLNFPLIALSMGSPLFDGHRFFENTSPKS